MSNDNRGAGHIFENDVRRIARQLWPHAEFSGAAIVDGREFDGIFDTEDCRHIIEATTSRRKEKAQQDIGKLVKLVRKNQRSCGTRAVRGWFITRDEPTADQRQVAKLHRESVNILSFAQFQARLVDSHTYLQLRDEYAFGSVRHPGGDVRSADVKYVPLDLVDLNSKEVVSCTRIVEYLSAGRVVVLLGDYGAGKSMTLREVYRDLKRRHLRDRVSTFPVFINLRDHYGQSDPAEIIDRHAKSIGFAHPSHLVRAWRAGYVQLLLDGFDEITALRIQGPWRKLRENRYRAMEGVRKLIREHPKVDSLGAEAPPPPGLLVAGRGHFFDNPAERRQALSLPSSAAELVPNEFTEQQIREYLETAGLRGFVPQWLPSRPLLVGYLATTHALNNLGGSSEDDDVDPAAGWDLLLDRVAAREAEIEAGIDGATVRRILERLATKARDTQSGLGPLTPETVVEGFREVCGYAPGDLGMVILQRLPGLGVYHAEEARIFVDEAFVDACRGGDLATFVEQPFDFDTALVSRIESGIGSLGIAIASRRTENRAHAEGKLNTAMEQARQYNCPYLVADVARLIIAMGCRVRKETVVSGVLVEELELGSLTNDVSGLQFSDCWFLRVELDSNADVAKIPAFRQCYIESLEGRVSRRDLPHDKFDEECIVEEFVETAETTTGVLMLDLPLGTRVCLTVLKKIFERRGSGRKENGLYRGLDQRARSLVPDVLQVLKSEGLAAPYRRRGETIWLPGRDRRRASRMIAAPNAEKDPVLVRCATLSG